MDSPEQVRSRQVGQSHGAHHRFPKLSAQCVLLRSARWSLMEHFLLALVLITADGPKQTSIEQPSLEECWKQAQAVIEKANTPKLNSAGVIGFGAGCIVVQAPTQESESLK